MAAAAKKKPTWQQVLLIAIVCTLCIMVLYPFWLLIVKSFKDYDQELESFLSLTLPLHFENYLVAWDYVKGSILNSMFVSGMIAVTTVTLSAMGAYAFAMYSFKLKNLLFSACVSLMMIPSILTLSSKYILVTVNLKLFNNFAGVILPQSAGLLPFGLLLLRGYFASIPKELFEAADIDGANSVYKFVKIMIPLTMSMLTTLLLMNFMTSWNDYLWPLMVLRDDTLFTIPINLQSFTDRFYHMTNYYAPALAGYVIVSIPLLFLFGFTSKQFISGMTSGAFKM